jgi:hypothetical protein
MNEALYKFIGETVFVCNNKMHIGGISCTYSNLGIANPRVTQGSILGPMLSLWLVPLCPKLYWNEVFLSSMELVSNVSETVSISIIRVWCDKCHICMFKDRLKYWILLYIDRPHCIQPPWKLHIIHETILFADIQVLEFHFQKLTTFLITWTIFTLH